METLKQVQFHVCMHLLTQVTVSHGIPEKKSALKVLAPLYEQEGEDCSTNFTEIRLQFCRRNFGRGHVRSAPRTGKWCSCRSFLMDFYMPTSAKQQLYLVHFLTLNCSY